MHDRDNQALSDAMSQLQGALGDGLEAAMRAVLRALLESVLIAGEEDGEPAVVEDEEDRVFLALFTSSLDLQLFFAGSPSIEIAGEEAVRRIAAGSYDGLVINPGSQQFELSREDVLDCFEVD